MLSEAIHQSNRIFGKFTELINSFLIVWLLIPYFIVLYIVKDLTLNYFPFLILYFLVDFILSILVSVFAIVRSLHE